MAGTKKKAPKARYGIAEWYGLDVTNMSPETRKELASVALKKSANIPLCPFLSNLVPAAVCNKTGGVCSIRKFEYQEEIGTTPVLSQSVVTICPSRFLATFPNGKNIFSWISSKTLNIENPVVVKETPFLRKVSDLDNLGMDDTDLADEKESKKAGRIDWIIVNPEQSKNDLDWVAIETQSLYFSGRGMESEWQGYFDTPDIVGFPKETRRPDYRSSGPKRLLPQLDVKVPVLRNWGKKVAVVIDRFFMESMDNLSDDVIKARTEADKLNNAEVVWFVVDYDPSLKMEPYKIFYTSLDNSRKALNATEPLGKDDFTENLREVIDDKSKINKVFRIITN